MSKYTFKTLVLMIVTMLFVGVFLLGCSSTKPATLMASGDTTVIPPETPSVPVTPPESTEQTVKLTLYFPNADANGLIAIDRNVVVKEQEVIKAIFVELATPPDGLEKPLPLGTTLLGATVSADDVATIDLSTAFQTNFGGGSAGEQMTMYSIVNSLTSLSNIQSVQFLLNGEKHDGILGNLDTSTPLKRNERLISK